METAQYTLTTESPARFEARLLREMANDSKNQTGNIVFSPYSISMALQMAMDFERRGYAFYQEQAEGASSPRAKAMWEYLAKAEDQHFTFLQKTHEYLSTNGVWYFDDQEFPIFYD